MRGGGACAGVGLALVAFCDLRFGAATAKLTTAAPKLGLPAEYGMSWTLPRLVGVARATDLLLSGRVVTVADTADWGLWNGVEADGAATVDEADQLRGDGRLRRRLPFHPVGEGAESDGQSATADALECTRTRQVVEIAAHGHLRHLELAGERRHGHAAVALQRLADVHPAQLGR